MKTNKCTLARAVQLVFGRTFFDYSVLIMQPFFIFKWKLQLFRRVFVRMIGGVYIRIEINHIRSALKPEKKNIITGNPTWREWKFNVWRILSYKTYIYLITYLLRILEWFQIKTWILSII